MAECSTVLHAVSDGQSPRHRRHEDRFGVDAEINHSQPCPAFRLYVDQQNERWEQHQQQEDEQRQIVIESIRSLRARVDDNEKRRMENDTELLVELRAVKLTLEHNLEVLEAHEKDMQLFRSLVAKGNAFLWLVGVAVAVVSVWPQLKDLFGNN